MAPDLSHWACDREEHHGRDTWWSKATLFMVAKKQRKEGPVTQYGVQGTNDLISLY